MVNIGDIWKLLLTRFYIEAGIFMHPPYDLNNFPHLVWLQALYFYTFTTELQYIIRYKVDGEQLQV